MGLFHALRLAVAVGLVVVAPAIHVLRCLWRRIVVAFGVCTQAIGRLNGTVASTLARGLFGVFWARNSHFSGSKMRPRWF